MRNITWMPLVALLFLFSGCATVDDERPIEVYTFQKDRVDQKLSGNQGYLKGEAPESTSPRKTKRTLIGVDVALPGGGDVEEPAEEASTLEYPDQGQAAAGEKADASATPPEDFPDEAQDLDEGEFLESSFVK